MYNIVLLCQYGASTGLVSEKIKQAAKERNIEVIVNAYSISEVGNVIDTADVILLGPQVRFKLKGLIKDYGEKGVPIIGIEVADYGRMDGEAILNSALKAINMQE